MQVPRVEIGRTRIGQDGRDGDMHTEGGTNVEDETPPQHLFNGIDCQ